MVNLRGVYIVNAFIELNHGLITIGNVLINSVMEMLSMPFHGIKIHGLETYILNIPKSLKMGRNTLCTEVIYHAG